MGFSRTGEIGELLVQYRLLSWNYPAELTSLKHPYDIIVDADGRLVRVQVKSSCQKSKGGKSLVYRVKYGYSPTTYAVGAFDILALASTDLERVVFRPYTKEVQTLVVRLTDFTEENERASWEEALKIILQKSD